MTENQHSLELSFSLTKVFESAMAVLLVGSISWAGYRIMDHQERLVRIEVRLEGVIIDIGDLRRRPAQ